MFAHVSYPGWNFRNTFSKSVQVHVWAFSTPHAGYITSAWGRIYFEKKFAISSFHCMPVIKIIPCNMPLTQFGCFQIPLSLIFCKFQPSCSLRMHFLGFLKNTLTVAIEYYWINATFLKIRIKKSNEEIFNTHAVFFLLEKTHFDRTRIILNHCIIFFNIAL